MQLNADVIRRIADLTNGRIKYKLFPNLEKVLMDMALKAVETALKGQYSCVMEVDHELPKEFLEAVRSLGFEINKMEDGTKYLVGWV